MLIITECVMMFVQQLCNFVPPRAPESFFFYPYFTNYCDYYLTTLKKWKYAGTHNFWPELTIFGDKAWHRLLGVSGEQAETCGAEK